MPAKRNSVNMRLAKSILLNEGVPNDCLSVTPIALFQKLTQQEIEELKSVNQKHSNVSVADAAVEQE